LKRESNFDIVKEELCACEAGSSVGEQDKSKKETSTGNSDGLLKFVSALTFPLQ
jgi:hypothetical protein